MGIGDVGSQLEEVVAVAVATIHSSGKQIELAGITNNVWITRGSIALPVNDGPLGIEVDDSAVLGC